MVITEKKIQMLFFLSIGTQFLNVYTVKLKKKNFHIIFC